MISGCFLDVEFLWIFFPSSSSSYVLWLSNSFLGFEIFVSRILVSVDLHVRHVPLLRRHSLVHLNETLSKNKLNECLKKVWTTWEKKYLLGRWTGVSPLQEDDADDHGGHECHAGKRQGEVHGAILVVRRLVTDRVALQSNQTLH